MKKISQGEPPYSFPSPGGRGGLMEGRVLNYSLSYSVLKSTIQNMKYFSNVIKAGLNLGH